MRLEAKMGGVGGGGGEALTDFEASGPEYHNIMKTWFPHLWPMPVLCKRWSHEKHMEATPSHQNLVPVIILAPTLIFNLG